MNPDPTKSKQDPPPLTLASPDPDQIDPGVADELVKRRGFAASFGYAVNGLLRTLCTQRNMKIHWVCGLAVMLVGMALELDLASRASVIFCVFVVICMEVLNTALENFVDLHVKHFTKTAMLAKDAAAAAVLVLAIGAVIVFADILFHGWRMVLNSGPAIIRTVVLGLPLLILMAVILWMKRNTVLITTFGFIAFALLSTLAWYSQDEVFSSCSLLLLVGGLLARSREPFLLAPIK